jgi:S-adenosylmethionine/arginine decarboxylase-like enzyme
MLFHKHLLINAKVSSPIQDEQEAIDFLTDLVNRIDMKIIKGPFASYVDKPGNKGLTAIVMIETSHIAFHIWDEANPGLLQFDLYTCGALDLDEVLKTLNERFNIVSMDYRLYDREDGFVLEKEGSKPKYVYSSESQLPQQWVRKPSDFSN